MCIDDICREALREEYDKGTTQADLGKRAGISHAHVNRLLNGRSTFSNLKLETMLKLLPQASITLSGSQVINNGSNHGIVAASAHGNSIVANNGGSHQDASPCQLESFRAALIMELLNLEIDPASLTEVLRAVRSFPSEGKKPGA